MSSVFGINHSKRAYLRDMKVFVLDNSLRESTVAQPKGHTLDDKSKILKEIKSCEFTDIIVGAFGPERRVDDAFCEKLSEHFPVEGPPYQTYAFSEISETFPDGDLVFGDDCIPTGLQKMKKYGIKNAIIEVDVAASYIDWDGKVSVDKAVEGLAFLLKWTQVNLPCKNKRHRNMVNLRDLPLAMIGNHQRLLQFVAGIAKLPVDIRPIAIIFEEPLGEYFSDEVANWASAIRKTMDDNGWKSRWQAPENEADGMLLYHVHEQYGLANATVLDVLAAGADGMWCALSEEGAPMGHASSTVALANLARLGNKDVMERFNTKNLVDAARVVASVTTGYPVNPKQVVYGSGAVDECFGFSAIAQGERTDSDYDGNGIIDDLDKFSVAGFMGLEDPPARISTLASGDLVAKHLKQCFGPNDSFNSTNGTILVAEIRKRLEENIKEDYNQPDKLAKLWLETFPDRRPSSPSSSSTSSS